MRIIKNILIFLVLIAVIAGSFWISFLLGKNILTPVKKPPTVELIGTKESDVMEQIGKITFEVESITSGLKDSPIATSEDIADYMTPKIASKRTDKIIEKEVKPSLPAAYEIQNGLFSSKANAAALVRTIKGLGYFAQMAKSKKYYRVSTSAQTLIEAKQIAKVLISRNIEAQIRRK